LTIWQLTATELARRIRARELSAREVVAAHLARIDAVNPAVNAIVTLTADRAMAAAYEADEVQARGGVLGPLHGLPIAHKDLQATAGVRTTFGSPVFANHVPAEDSPLVARLKAAGAIAVGKTNTPEFGAGSQTFNPVFGATLNPYNTGRTCGGSSGGAAVALACGMIPIADGTDMGGSLRNPAAFCGVVGMRPTARLIPWADASSGVASLSVDGPMARTVSDLALLLGALAGVDGSAAAWSPDRQAMPLRVAWWHGYDDMPFDPRIAAAVDAQRAVFESQGCRVDAAQPDFSGADAVFKTLRAAAFVRKYSAVVSAHPSLVKETIHEEIDRGRRLTDGDIAAAERQRDALRSRVRRFMQDYDCFVMPTTQVAPFDVHEPFVREINGKPMPSYIDWMRSCYYVSAIGHPAISVPCGVTADGLPVGLQLMGRDDGDWPLIAIAHRFERARAPMPAPPTLPRPDRL
jgi:amidase